jgi:hypothetical protein
MEPSTWLAQHLSDVVAALAVAGSKLEPKPVTVPTAQHDSLVEGGQ